MRQSNSTNSDKTVFESIFLNFIQFVNFGLIHQLNAQFNQCNQNQMMSRISIFSIVLKGKKLPTLIPSSALAYIFKNVASSCFFIAHYV